MILFFMQGRSAPLEASSERALARTGSEAHRQWLTGPFIVGRGSGPEVNSSPRRQGAVIAVSQASRWLEELGEQPWAVLGGGGLKGLAHIGAWQALEESGIRPLGIVGTSIGALVGAALAGGLGWRDLAPLAISLKKEDIIRVNRRAVWGQRHS